ncbi:hypothetical protein TBLA_0F00840 [Henningerozyma blattae CBS 6284]|uniref:MHD domain-containing protein n=1 Tax=Henningerozyma blattae (strain ATCC 34711 / CBS 6284 / DSM 70876 / NBRC 10599 / NRRL Y-10934 / UCD 77-7) TaxID=1071380 RepID=I2H5H6_HENB6|nr:hypothetical protein TBLA_0F00840 [Tetrapisispora blattae CBS 6284]CCH61628.1 hypothetical protein TBLA_0F00840 [Tetrapisispora blattae CBS 6284]
MINAVMIFTPRGELLVFKVFKSSVKRTISDIFRVQVINNDNIRSPILTLGSTTFHFIRTTAGSKLWLVAVTRSNADSGAIWEYLYKLNSLMEVYGLTHEDILKDEFIVCHELLDITLGMNGLPMDTELSSVIGKMTLKPAQVLTSSADRSDILASSVTTLGHNSTPISMPKFLSRNSNRSVTQEFESQFSPSNIPWRSRDIKYKKNEMIVNVIEKINVLVGKDDNILRAYVDGTIDITAHLSGMPMCQIGMNDLSTIQGGENAHWTNEDRASNRDAMPDVSGDRVILEGSKFHQCVALDKYNKDNVIWFIPPDGQFELMKYHVSNNLNLPFRITPQVTLTSHGTALSYAIKLKSLFPRKLSAENVVLRIPVPPGTLDCKINASDGKCKFIPEENCMVWSFHRFNGSTENHLNAQTVPTQSIASQSIKQWTRPPMSLDFKVLMFSNTGLIVRYLKVQEKNMHYNTIKWIKYISAAGSYEVRY